LHAAQPANSSAHADADADTDTEQSCQFRVFVKDMVVAVMLMSAAFSHVSDFGGVGRDK
jgi:hypothetical protein